MNNTSKADAVRAILSHKLTDYEAKEETINLYFDINEREINHKVANLEKNEKNLQVLKAINFLLTSINY